MVVRTPIARTRRAFTAAEFAALQAAGVFAGHPAATWANADVVWAADGAPYRFSVEQYHRMIDSAVLGEDDRVELIAGEVLHKMPIGDRHISCVIRLTKVFTRRYAALAAVSVQNPLVLAESEPEPDLVLLADRPDDYAAGKPRPADAFLVVEVADSSLDDDLGPKAGLYAADAVAEYWVVDLTTDTVHVHRDPRPDGTWATITTHSRGDTLAVVALPGVTVPVADVLP